MRGRITLALALAAAAILLLVVASASAQGGLTGQEQLGKDLFFDQNLSLNNNQACAACHAPNVGWTGPDQTINLHGGVYEGSIPGAFGDRKPPSAAYGGDSPILHFDIATNTAAGGMFWDGRASGWNLQDPLAEQAKGPFLNPKEQAIPDAATLVAKVLASSYAGLFAQQCPDADTTLRYNCIGRAIAAFERSAEVSPYASKYDSQGKGRANKLTGEERLGMQLFFGKAKCANCHSGRDFTDFTYDNLGIPKNPENPATMANPGWSDPGLGGFLATNDYLKQWAPLNTGKFKVPTVRNVDKRPSPDTVKAYGHNAYFKSLEGIVHFYNTRDVLATCPDPLTKEVDALAANCWPAPETPENVNMTEVGNLGLNKNQEAAIVAFLKTLSDK